MTIANQEQADHWNSEEASHWVTHQAAYDRMLAPFSDMVLAAAALRPATGSSMSAAGAGQRPAPPPGPSHPAASSGSTCPSRC